MKKVIWKYKLNVNDLINLKIPKGARILTLQMQHNIPCLWVLVNPENEMELRRFILKGTGHIWEDTGYNEIYIGTVLYTNVVLVFHLFEITNQ